MTRAYTAHIPRMYRARISPIPHKRYTRAAAAQHDRGSRANFRPKESGRKNARPHSQRDMRA
jgi:hypothetical protein